MEKNNNINHNKESSSECCDLLSWKEPKTTGLILASFNFVFFAALFSNSSFLGVLANIALMILGTSICICYFMEKPKKDDNEYEYFSKDKLEEQFRKVYGLMIYFDKSFKRATSLDNPKYTIKVIAFIYVFQIIVSLVCNMLLIWILVNLAFVYPLLYKTKSKEINSIYEKAHSSINYYYVVMEKKIPRYLEKEKNN